MDPLNVMALFGMMFCAATMAWSPDTLRIDREFASKWCSLALRLLLPAKILLMFLAPGMLKPEAVSLLLQVPVKEFAGVWWEDGFYVLPFVLAAGWLDRMAPSRRRTAATWAFRTARLLAIAVFASLHSYQGILGLGSILYWCFSYQLGRRNGVGTSMVCHIAIDFTALLALYFHTLAVGGGIF